MFSRFTTAHLKQTTSITQSEEWTDLASKSNDDVDSDGSYEKVERPKLNTEPLDVKERVGEWLEIMFKDSQKTSTTSQTHDSALETQQKKTQLHNFLQTISQHICTDSTQFRKRLEPHLKFNKLGNATHTEALHDLSLRLRGTPYWFERHRIAHLKWQIIDNKIPPQLFYKNEIVRLEPEDHELLQRCKSSCTTLLPGARPIALFPKYLESNQESVGKKNRVNAEITIGEWIDNFLDREINQDANQRLALLHIPLSKGKVVVPITALRDMLTYVLSSEGLSQKFIASLKPHQFSDDEMALFAPEIKPEQKILLNELIRHVVITAGEDSPVFPNAETNSSTAEKLQQRLSKALS